MPQVTNPKVMEYITYLEDCIQKGAPVKWIQVHSNGLWRNIKHVRSDGRFWTVKAGEEE
jgi:hypothetical protein